MDPLAVRCLRCGERHELAQAAWRYIQESACPRCGYVGWTAVEPAGGTRFARIGGRVPSAPRLHVVRS